MSTEARISKPDRVTLVGRQVIQVYKSFERKRVRLSELCYICLSQLSESLEFSCTERETCRYSSDYCLDSGNSANTDYSVTHWNIFTSEKKLVCFGNILKNFYYSRQQYVNIYLLLQCYIVHIFIACVLHCERLLLRAGYILLQYYSNVKCNFLSCAAVCLMYTERHVAIGRFYLRSCRTSLKIKYKSVKL